MPDAYIPILRPGRNERNVIQTFGGLSQFSTHDRNLDLRPLVEVATDDHLEQLAPYRDAGQEVYIDLPGYWSRRSTKFTDAINRTLRNYGSREEFFRSNRSQIDVPVVSTFADRPVQYGVHESMHLALEDSFPRIVHRVMLRSQWGSLTTDQRSTLQDVSERARPGNDLFLFDVVDVGYQENENLDTDLDFLTTTFESQETAVLNVFDALDGQPENVTPRLAERFGCEAFGDFAIDKRYPKESGGPPPRTYLRHYYPNYGRVEEFEGSDYEEAARNLVSWADYDGEHCEWCRRAASAVEHDDIGNPSKWKRIRMGHYIESALQYQI